jgi:copper chaperone CopZ
MKSLSVALLAASLLLSSNIACIAESVEHPPQTKLEGKITEVSAEVSKVTSNVDNNEISSKKILDVLDQTSHPKIVKAGLTRKTASKVLSLGNFILDLRGFDWSVEGADVALEEKLTYKSEIAKEFAVRRTRDQRELEAVCAVLQTSMASGMDNAARKEKLLTAGNSKLVELFGEDSTAQLLERLKQLSTDQTNATLDVSGEAASWTVDEQQEKFKLIVESTIEQDPQIRDILIRLHKFNGRSTFMRVTAKLVYTSLGLASFAPSFIAPVAEVSLLAFMTATGGPEQDKLLREMYLYKCLESRYKTIHEEAHLAVTNAQVAALTGNKPLAICSMELVGRIAGAPAVAKVFPTFDSQQVASRALVEEIKQTAIDTDCDDSPRDHLN